MNLALVLCALCMFYHICGGILISVLVLNNKTSKVDIDKKEFIFAAIFPVITMAMSVFAETKWGGDRFFIMTVAEGIYILRCDLSSPKEDKRIAIFVCVFYEMAHLLIAKLATAYTAVMLNDKRYLDPYEVRSCIIYLIVAFIVMLIAVSAYFKKELSARIGVRVVAAIAIISMVLINLLLTINNKMLNSDDVYSWMYYALGLLGAVFVLQMRKQYEVERELAEMKSNEAMILERQYYSLSESYERNAKLFHDFRNHCGVLKNYLAKDKPDEALKYLEDLTGEGSSYNSEVWTGDETVDYLITSKKALAEQKSIAFEADVEFPRNTNIKSNDLCTILGNVLDNAVEACERVDDPDKRKVRLIIRRIQQMLIIKVENTYENKPIVVEGDYKTSKTDGGLHGWGIKSAETAAEKYDGMVQSSCTDDLFTTVVTLSFEGVRVE